MKSKKVKLNIGCGIGLRAGFLNIDLYIDLKKLKEGIKTKSGLYRNAVYEKGAEFLKGDICALPLEDNYADYIECRDVIEHVEHRKIEIAFSEMYRVLKKGGTMKLLTPDFNGVVRQWIKTVLPSTQAINLADFDPVQYKNIVEVVYGNQAGGVGELHKTPFTPHSMLYALARTGWDLAKCKLVILQEGAPVKNMTQLMVPPGEKDKTKDTKGGMRNDYIYVEIIK